MQKIWIITLFASVVCSVGTGLGGVIATSFKRSNKHIMSSIMGMAGGLMMSIVTFDLIPEAIRLGGMGKTLLGIFIGVVFTVLIDILIPEDAITKKYGKEAKTAAIMGIGLAAHNFPEGLAIGSGFMGGMNLGLELSTVIALHDIPEGAAVASPLMQSSMPRGKIIFYTILTALPTAIGAFIGAYISNISNYFVTLCLGFAGGTMLYIVCGELIPDSKNLYKGVLSTLSIIVGFVLGLIITSIFN
ncbi:MAG TPA: ZIP family metal transporter [Clostridiaceae bacterium]|nr:ZIP family metal transporter [Clostridiaceae bacterium]HBG39386.1 ZIP family metal transporter [Clostridiaceae bacterium]HBN27446.1 ZIP family metal transporter [Clostridiaceae bacterium]HBX47787.1 ZIP family metal transporter [Clostridiaceae bacterium]